MEIVRSILGRKSASTLIRVAAVNLPLTCALSAVLNPHLALASMAYFFLVAGLIHRRERAAHARLMGAGMALDVFLVLLLQAQRSAVQTLIQSQLTPLQLMHIGFSLAAVLIYIPVLYFGWRRYTGQASVAHKKWHLQLGILAFAFRTLGYIFMFSMAK